MLNIFDYIFQTGITTVIIMIKIFSILKLDNLDITLHYTSLTELVISVFVLKNVNVKV